MILNGIGKIVNEYWNNIPIHFPNIIFDEFIIMPNHIHGIIIIDYAISINSKVRVEYIRPQQLRSIQLLYNYLLFNK